MSDGPATCHGVLLAVVGAGLLVTGPAGCGKSALALELLRRGHQLVADDAVELELRGGELLGRCPAGLTGLLHLRALGIIQVDTLFGPQAVRAQAQRVDLALLLGPLPEDNPDSRWQGHRDLWEIAGARLPRLRLDPQAGPYLATLAEAALMRWRGEGAMAPTWAAGDNAGAAS